MNVSYQVESTERTEADKMNCSIQIHIKKIVIEQYDDDNNDPK